MLNDKRSGIGFGWFSAIGLVFAFGVASGTASAQQLAQSGITIETLSVNGQMHDIRDYRMSP